MAGFNVMDMLNKTSKEGIEDKCCKTSCEFHGVSTRVSPFGSKASFLWGKTIGSTHVILHVWYIVT